MLRLLVLVLVIVNAGYYAWSHHMLASYGYAPVQQSEPERLSQQIRPDALTILTTEQERQLDAAARTADKVAQCLQAGPFDEAQSAALRQVVQAVLPAGSWAFDEVVEPARWIIYMGQYADAQTLAKKRAELAALNLDQSGTGLWPVTWRLRVRGAGQCGAGGGGQTRRANRPGGAGTGADTRKPVADHGA